MSSMIFLCTSHDSLAINDSISQHANISASTMCTPTPSLIKLWRPNIDKIELDRDSHSHSADSTTIFLSFVGLRQFPKIGDSESILYSKELILLTILWPKTVILNRFRIVANRNRLSPTPLPYVCRRPYRISAMGRSIPSLTHSLTPDSRRPFALLMSHVYVAVEWGEGIFAQ